MVNAGHLQCYIDMQILYHDEHLKHRCHQVIVNFQKVVLLGNSFLTKLSGWEYTNLSGTQCASSNACQPCWMNILQITHWLPSCDLPAI